MIGITMVMNKCYFIGINQCYICRRLDSLEKHLITLPVVTFTWGWTAWSGPCRLLFSELVIQLNTKNSTRSQLSHSVFFCSDLAFFAKRSAQIKNQLLKSAQIWVLRFQENWKSAQLRVLRYHKITKMCSVQSAQIRFKPSKVLSSWCSEYTIFQKKISNQGAHLGSDLGLSPVLMFMAVWILSLESLSFKQRCFSSVKMKSTCEC